MKWPSGRQQDRAFGPRFPGAFDFTLRFEHLILTILPILVFILMAAWYIWYICRQSICLRAGGLYRVHLVFMCGLVAVEIASLGLWCTPSFRSPGAIGAAVMSCAGAIVLAVVVSVENRRSLQSSALIGAYVLMSLLLDIVKTRSYFLRSMQAIAALSTVGAALKFTLLTLFEVSKRRDIMDPDLKTNIGEEAVSGFWNRTFLVWLNPTFIIGFRRVIVVDDLSALGPEFFSEDLFNRLEYNWKRVNQNSKSSLFKACFVTFYVEFLSVVPPRLCFSGFILTQPLYLRRVVNFIGETHPSVFVRTGLILSCVLLFLGLAASRSLYQQMNYRMVTMIRGALIPHILQKTLAIPYSVAKESAAATLMSTDIEGIATGVTQFHEMWGAALEVSIGLYLLSTMIDEATFLVVLPVIVSVLAMHFIGKLYAKGLGAWNEKIQRRVSLTTKVLLQAKSIKMIGLENTVSDMIKKSRLTEIASFKTVRLISGGTVVISVLTYTMSPVLAIAGGLFWTTFEGRLTAVDAFTTLAIVIVITTPLMGVLHSYPLLRGIVVCFERIQSYFVLKEVRPRNDGRVRDETSTSDAAALEKQPIQASENLVLEYKDAYIVSAPDAEPILRDVSFSILLQQFTVLLGPVGSGKSMLLRSILGESVISQGHFWCKPGNFAYCGQITWLRNIPVRANIIGMSPFNQARYSKVVQACCLEDDLQQLPGGLGDMTLAGSNGANLSGGQKHRVALARAVYSEESTVILDDVLSGLDPEMTQAIYTRLFDAEGLLREAGRTVILATHAVDFLKAADQALVFDGNGGVAVQAEPSELALDHGFVDKLEQREATDEKLETESHVDNAPVLSQHLAQDQELQSRSRGDASLYKYFVMSTSKWKGIVFIMSLALVVGCERFPEVYMRVWLEVDPENNTYFAGYAAIGGAGFIISGLSLWLYFMHLVPENGIRLHTTLLNSAMGATLDFLTSTDAGSIVNRFSQDMTLLTQKLPVNFYQVLYMGYYLIYDIAIIVSGAKYAALLVPFVAAIFYILQKFYLRTSRQVRYLDIEAKAPLYTLFTETSTPNGLEHIRAFGWQSSFTKEGMRALDYSQRPFYYMYIIQRWLELAMDLIGLLIALILVCIVTFFQETTSQAGLGLSMLNLVTFSNMMNIFVGDWTNLETSLGALARLRTFVQSTPQEARKQRLISPPQSWPEAGNVKFTCVNAKYKANGSPVLEDVSFSVLAKQKVGITGRSGSGKSSMLLTLLGLLDYTGKIEIDGVDVASVSPQLLRSRITTISQDVVQLEGSVRDNLVPYKGQLDDGRIDDALVLKTLERVGLSEAINGKGGLGASLSDMSLSQGQLQFLSLARAILHNHWTGGKLVILDEPTSNMDSETDAKIRSLVRSVFKDCTVLMISHRQEALNRADVYLEVANGRVTSSEEVFLPADTAS